MTPRYAAASLVLLGIFLTGWADSWDAIATGARAVRSVRADFTQEKHLPILVRPLISQGYFLYQAPDSLRWEYRTPLRSILMQHEGRTRRWLQGPDGTLREESGAQLEAMGVVSAEIRHWLAGEFGSSTYFEAALAGGGMIVLTPRQPAMARIIARIEVRLSATPGVIDTVTIHEGPEAYTRLTFHNTELNAALSAHLFREAG